MLHAQVKRETHGLVVPVLGSCQSPIRIWLVKYLHLHLHLHYPWYGDVRTVPGAQLEVCFGAVAVRHRPCMAMAPPQIVATTAPTRVRTTYGGPGDISRADKTAAILGPRSTDGNVHRLMQLSAAQHPGGHQNLAQHRTHVAHAGLKSMHHRREMRGRRGSAPDASWRVDGYSAVARAPRS